MLEKVFFFQTRGETSLKKPHEKVWKTKSESQLPLIQTHRGIGALFGGQHFEPAAWYSPKPKSSFVGLAPYTHADLVCVWARSTPKHAQKSRADRFVGTQCLFLPSLALVEQFRIFSSTNYELSLQHRVGEKRGARSWASIARAD
jgi:hypothetical protein